MKPAREVAPGAEAEPGGNGDLSWRLVRPNGRSQELVAFDETVVAFFLDSATLLGVPRSIAAIYGICFASPEPLSFTEVRNRLNLSAGSISQGLRVLREVGALKVITDDDRRELFTPDLELRKLFSHFLDERLQKQLESGRGRLNAIGKSIPYAENGLARMLKTRLKSLQTWHDKTRALLPVARAFLKVT